MFYLLDSICFINQLNPFALSINQIISLHHSKHQLNAKISDITRKIRVIGGSFICKDKKRSPNKLTENKTHANIFIFIYLVARFISSSNQV